MLEIPGVERNPQVVGFNGDCAGPREAYIRLLENLDRRTVSYLVGNSGSIPVCQTYASMTRRATNHVGMVGTVDTNPFLVQSNPGNAYRISGARRNIEKVPAPSAVPEHRLVPAKPG